ncbi:vitamin K epoxide reductase family protein [Herbiconiux sp. L3-i23]|uniref:vitamin K epoxide reductase family protein n=1 Tax=Herbiconiux sp. L3-i23 TaxID=2905871 RepID=UPI00204B6DE4|nr:vitamin K epoxide reductase family protein [Herbiconiux sp. L3-i23]BDI23156.1 hypothetical protein L3i23_19320 [Herbiconiux sp. L3-i23]
MTNTTPARRPIAMSILFIVTGLIGLWASFQLVLERFQLIEAPGEALGCDINPFVACSTVIQSAQGSVFGFPNPLLGVMGFVAPIAVGVALLARARFDRWFWIFFNAGLVFAIVFIHWLMTQTVYVIGTLCPYCLVVWTVTIPLFWYGTVWNLAKNFGLTGSAQRFFQGLLKWTWIIVLVDYAIILLIIYVNFPLLPTLLFR